MQRTEIHGHRGARGLLPENTMVSFLHAIKLGVDAIEMDVVISRDKKVVVSHEPWMNSQFCAKPNGKRIRKGEVINTYKMDYASIKKYDCGHSNKKFPKQKSRKAYKPLLTDVIKKVEEYIADLGQPCYYNIEIKSLKSWDDKFHPSPKEYAKLVYGATKKFNLSERLLFQSFDPRILKELKKINKELKLGLLVEKVGNFTNHIRSLGFIPYAYSPHYELVTNSLVSTTRKKGIKMFVWTVNTSKQIKKYINMGVDGIITDYPDMAIKLVK